MQGWGRLPRVVFEAPCGAHPWTHEVVIVKQRLASPADHQSAACTAASPDATLAARRRRAACRRRNAGRRGRWVGGAGGGGLRAGGAWWLGHTGSSPRVSMSARRHPVSIDTVVDLVEVDEGRGGCSGGRVGALASERRGVGRHVGGRGWGQKGGPRARRADEGEAGEGARVVRGGAGRGARAYASEGDWMLLDSTSFHTTRLHFTWALERRVGC